MKKGLVIIFIIFCSSLKVQAQVELINGSEWAYNIDWFFWHPDSVNTLKITGDTIINGKNSKILENEYWNCNLRPKKDYIYQENDRIFYYHFEDSIFYLLYDFGAELGDTLAIHTWGQYSDVAEYFYLKIDSIGSETIGNQSVRKFKAIYGKMNDVGEIVFSDYTFEIIEGIGCTVNFFYLIDTGWCDASYVNKLLCYYNPEIGEFGETIYCNIGPDNVNNTQAIQTLKIYPNPFSNEINIQTDESSVNLELKLYNQLGVLVYDKEIQNKSTLKNTIMNISNIKDGFYYLLITDVDNGKIRSETLIKHTK